MQVLSYSKRRHCLNQFKDEQSENSSPERKGNSSCRRKNNSLELRPTKHSRVDAATDVMDKHTDDQRNMGIYSGEQAPHMQEFEEGSSRCILTGMKPPRQSRFIWSDKTDR